MSNLILKSYEIQKAIWPPIGKHILAQFDDKSIIVYQAYNLSIASEIVKNKTFHAESCQAAGFNLTRTTWIKTNFLWMMYRSNWAQSQNQERILAFRITREGFDEILSKSAVSKTGNSEKIKKSDVVLQWDPDHRPNGSKVIERRAVQLGLRGSTLIRFSKEFIIDVTDITDLVEEQRENLNDLNNLVIPEEHCYEIIDSSIRAIIEIDENNTKINN